MKILIEICHTDRFINSLNLSKFDLKLSDYFLLNRKCIQYVSIQILPKSSRKLAYWMITVITINFVFLLSYSVELFFCGSD